MGSKNEKELLFSVTAKDCVFQAFKGSGPGGQHRNKTSTAIRCTHPPSGAVGVASDDKSQHRNKKKAFRRMAESDKFKRWVKIEIARITGQLKEVEKEVDKQLQPNKIKTEIQEDGKWVTLTDNGGSFE